MTKSANINGAELAYEVSGDGRPIIFVHGFLARSTGDYYKVFKTLLAKNHKVFFLDMRSHGGSAAIDKDVTLDQGARDIAAFARSQRLDGALLVGHSMGGYLSRAAALHAPDQFRALALLTPAGSRGQPTPEEFVLDFLAARKDPALMSQRFGGMFLGPREQGELDILREAALCLSDAVAERWMREEWPNSNQTERLASIDLPVLSLIGAKDVVVPADRQYADALLPPRGKVVTFNDEGHMLPLENPERTATEVLRFFQDVA